MLAFIIYFHSTAIYTNPNTNTGNSMLYTNVKCSPELMASWKPYHSHEGSLDGMTVRKAPFFDLFIVETKGQEHRGEYFPEVLMLLDQHRLTSNVYFHSGPVYLALLIATAVEEQVKMIFSSDYPETEAALNGFALNNILPKYELEVRGNSLQNMEKADIIVTSSTKLLKTQKGKHCLLYTSPSPRDQRGSRMPSSA